MDHHQKAKISSPFENLNMTEFEITMNNMSINNIPSCNNNITNSSPIKLVCNQTSILNQTLPDKLEYDMNILYTYKVPFDGALIRKRMLETFDKRFNFDFTKQLEMINTERDATIDSIETISNNIANVKSDVVILENQIHNTLSSKKEKENALIAERDQLLEERERLLVQIEDFAINEKKSSNKKEKDKEEADINKEKLKNYTKHNNAYEHFLQMKIEKDTENQEITFTFKNKGSITIQILDNISYSVKKCLPEVDYGEELRIMNATGDIRRFIILLREKFYDL